MKTKVLRFAFFIVFLFLLGCKPGQLLGPKITPTPSPTATLPPTPTPDPLISRSGEWQGETESGEFNFVVSPDGKFITDFYLYNKIADEVYSLSELGIEEGLISEDNNFSVIPWDGKVWFFCQFSNDGMRANGFWDWEIWLTPDDESAENWEIIR